MIEVKAEGGRWTVTLDRPDKANALSLAMLEALDDVLAEAAADDSLRVLVLTGAGERVFSAGADLSEARDATSITLSPVWESVSGRIAALPCLTIAALNGTLAGGAFGMALACDLRLAVPGAKFFYPVLKNGFLPQPSDAGRMVALIGPARTRLILLGGQKLDAAEALSIGLIDRIVEREAMEDTLAALSTDAMAATPHVLAAIKRLTRGDASDEDKRYCVAAVYEGDEAAHRRLLGR
jgi:enoyl-CoA hydratase/carnithine racemase